MFITQKFEIYHGEFAHALAPHMVYTPLDVLRTFIEMFDFELTDVVPDRSVSELGTEYSFSIAAAHNGDSSIRSSEDRANNCFGIACWFKIEDEFLFLDLVRAFKGMGNEITEEAEDTLNVTLGTGFTSKMMEFALEYINILMETDESE